MSYCVASANRFVTLEHHIGLGKVFTQRPSPITATSIRSSPRTNGKRLVQDQIAGQRGKHRLHAHDHGGRTKRAVFLADDL